MSFYCRRHFTALAQYNTLALLVKIFFSQKARSSLRSRPYGSQFLRLLRLRDPLILVVVNLKTISNCDLLDGRSLLRTLASSGRAGRSSRRRSARRSSLWCGRSSRGSPSSGTIWDAFPLKFLILALILLIESSMLDITVDKVSIQVRVTPVTLAKFSADSTYLMKFTFRFNLP